MRAGILVAVGFVVAVAMAVIVVIWNRNRDPDPSGRFTVTPIRVDSDPFKLAARPAGPGDGADEVYAAVVRFTEQADKLVEGRRSGSVPPETHDLAEQVSDLWMSCCRTPDKVAAGSVPPFTCAADLLASAGKGEFHYDKHLAAGSLEWDPPNKLLTTFECLAEAALAEGFLAGKRGERDQAEQIYKAVLIYGWRLADTHVRVGIQLEGLSAQREAGDALFALWKESQPDKAEAAFQYARSAEHTAKKVQAAYGPLFRLPSGWDVADLIYFARRHPDPAWQVEAVLTSGMCRHSKAAARFGKVINRCLDDKAADKDPFVAAAADWGRKLTSEGQVAQRRFKQE